MIDTSMEENGDTMSTIFSEALDAANHDPQKISNNQHLSSPTKGFGPFYGQWLGSLVSPFAASEVISPNASQMSFSLVSPYPLSPTNAQDSLPTAMTNNTLFPRGDHLSLLFSPNIFSPHSKANNPEHLNAPATVSTMKAEKLSNLLQSNQQQHPSRYNSSTPKSLYEHVYSNSNQSSRHIHISNASYHTDPAPATTTERSGRSRKKVIMET
jgi:hypothetical protein